VVHREEYHVLGIEADVDVAEEQPLFREGGAEGLEASDQCLSWLRWVVCEDCVSG